MAGRKDRAKVMKPLPAWRIENLRKQHMKAVARGDKSAQIRKGWVVEDEKALALGGGIHPSRAMRPLTDEEIEEITRPTPLLIFSEGELP